MRGERRRLRPHLGKLPGEAFAGALWANQNGKKPMPPPLFFERVRTELKAKSLEWQMLCTENGRVRNKQKTRGLREDVPKAWDRKDLSQEAAGRPSCGWQARGSRGREGIVAWRIMLDITTEE